MAKKEYYCPYCPTDEPPFGGPQGLASHIRTRHPGKKFDKNKHYGKRNGPKKRPRRQRKDDPVFVIEPAEGAKGNAAQGSYDAEVRIRLVIKIDVES